MSGKTTLDVSNDQREVLVGIFKEGGRASDNWDTAIIRASVVAALSKEKVELSEDQLDEFLTIMNGMLNRGYLTFQAIEIVSPILQKLTKRIEDG